MTLLLSAELQLVLAAALFYAWDNAVLLDADEGLLSPYGRRGWSVRLARSGLEFRTRYLHFPALLLPWAPAYRLRWNASEVGVGVSRPWLDAPRRSWRAAAVFASIAALLVFFALPVLLFVVRSEVGLLLCAGALYVNCVCAAAWLWLRRREIDLRPARAASLAAECLLCPPLTVNLVRKLTLPIHVQADLFSTAHALLDKEAQRSMAPAWTRAIEDELLETDDPARLTKLRRSLAAVHRECGE